jgi:Arc/MetJ-type ribon-helix-helix transcriptional regulator
MTVDIPESLESSILAAVRDGRYASLDDAMAEAASLLVERLARETPQTKQSATPQTTPAARKPIWELIEEENRSIPSEVWDALPIDLSEQHDHYIYGTPKRPAQ